VPDVLEMFQLLVMCFWWFGGLVVWFGVKQDSRAETMAKSGSFMYPWSGIYSENAVRTDTRLHG
jgi:hypothetical protein